MTWRTAAPGIRYREHSSRKHGVKSDRYFTLRFQVAGKQVEEALGWASEGWSVNRAQEELGKLREANRTGQGLATLRERRQKAEEQRRAEELQARGEKTMAYLWDRYSKEVMAIHNSARTIAEKTRMWRARIKPAIGNVKVKDVTEDDAGAVVRAPLKLKGGKVVAGKAEAGNLYRLLHHMFRKSLAWRIRPRELGNPLEDIAEPKVERRSRLLTMSEVGALLNALDKATIEGIEPRPITAAIKAAILTGARISEILGLRWEHIRREDSEMHLPDTKSGFSRRPISPEALAVIDTVPRMPGVPYIFRSIDRPRNSLSYHTVEKAFRRIRDAAGVKACSLHSLRHWFATLTANSVNNPRVGMALTGHRSHAAYMQYIHGDKEQAQALAEQLGTFAAGLVKAAPKIEQMRKMAKR